MTFRPIDIAGFVPATLAEQPVPTMIWAELAQLVIDDRYQRALTPPGRRAIQRIADAWDWSKYQPILVAATTDGRLAVVDGQHRAHAAAVAGLTALPAMVVPMTPVQQATAFAAVNTDRIKLAPAQLFKARLAAGDPVAVEAARLCEEAGCRLMTYNPSAAYRRPGDVFAYKLIMGMADTGEGPAVVAALAAIRQSELGAVRDDAADRSSQLRPYDFGVLKVWLPAVASSQRFLRLPLADVFDSIDWDDLADRARRHVRSQGGSNTAFMIDRVKFALRSALDAKAAA
jgi:hypothetical protein